MAESFGNVINFDPQVDPMLFDLDVKAHSGTITPEEIKGFARFLNSHKADFIRVYHATSARHDIMSKGLLPTSPGRAKSIQSTSGYVYVSYDPNNSVNFARMAYAGDFTTTIVVYAMDVLVRRLLPDHDQLYNKRMWGNNPDIGATLADSLIYGHGARIKGKVDPMQLHIWGEFDRAGNRIDNS